MTIICSNQLGTHVKECTQVPPNINIPHLLHGTGVSLNFSEKKIQKSFL